jgi:hypothetical protein
MKAPPTTATGKFVTAVDDLQGLWRRSLIARPDGGRDTTTSVHWLQGPRAYIDLRQPHDAPDFSHARTLADLTLEDCAWLARQEGFAGHLCFDGAHFEWVREIDFQPPSPSADAGSLRWEGDVLIETGRDVAYIEHWHRDASTPTLPTSRHTLEDAARNTKGILLRVGPNFMLARDRSVALQEGYRSLAEYVAAAPDVKRARELVDCEISCGHVEPAGLRITASTLPYRVGAILDLDALEKPNGAPHRSAGRR